MEIKKPQYLLEFPSEDFKKEVKTISALTGETMKDFIINAISNEIKKRKEMMWED